MKLSIKTISIFFVSFLVLFVISIKSFSQGKYTKGDRVYDDKQYYKALTFYEQEVKARPISLTTVKKIKIANCYYNLLNYNKSYDFFKQVDLTIIPSRDKVVYGLVLQKLGKYNEALNVFNLAKKEGVDDLLLNNYIEACNWSKQNNKNISDIGLQASNINVYKQSFGTQYYKDGIVYSSTSPKYYSDWLDKIGFKFLDIYYKDIKAGEVSGEPYYFSKTLSGFYHEGSIAFSSDYKTIYFTKVIELSKNKYVLKIFEATRGKDDWENIKELSFNSNSFSCAHSTLSSDGNVMVFTSDMKTPTSKGGKDLYVVNKLSTGKWGNPINLGKEINTAGDEVFPYISPKNILFFSSNGLAQNYGGLDMYYAVPKRGIWSSVTNMGKPLNSSCDDFAFVINPKDEKKGLLSSNRTGENNDNYDNVYSVPVYAFPVYNLPNYPLPKYESDADALIEEAMKADEKSKLLVEEQARIKKEKEEKEKLSAKKRTAKEKAEQERLKKEQELKDKIKKEQEERAKLEALKKKDLVLEGEVKDYLTNSPIENAKVSLYNKKDNSLIDEQTTGRDGKYKFVLDGNKNLNDLDVIVGKVKTDKYKEMSFETDVKKIKESQNKEKFNPNSSTFVDYKEYKNYLKYSEFTRKGPSQDCKDNYKKGAEYKDYKNNKAYGDYVDYENYKIYKKDSAYFKDNSDYKLYIVNKDYKTRNKKLYEEYEKYKNCVDFQDYMKNRDSFGASTSSMQMQPIIEKGTELTFNNIIFKLGSADLTPEAQYVLDRVAVALKESDLQIKLEAHTDSQGDNQSNMKLSQKRADSAMKYLVYEGIDKKRIITQGFGETMIKNHCKDGVPCSDIEHSVNRRIELKILK